MRKTRRERARKLWRDWTKSSTVQAALITSAGTLMAAFIAGAFLLFGREDTKQEPRLPPVIVRAVPAEGQQQSPSHPPPQPPDPELVSFTLNTEESYFERVDDPSHYYTLGVTGPIWMPTDQWYLVDYSLGRGSTRERDLEDEFPEHPAMGSEGPSVDAIVRADSVERAKLRSRLAPVFDITLINRGEMPAVLWGVVADILFYKDSWGASTPARRTDPATIPVIHRYAIQVQELVEHVETTGRPDTIRLLPPIEIPARRTARLQVQLLTSAPEATIFNSRLQFLFNGSVSVSTGPFAVEM